MYEDIMDDMGDDVEGTDIPTDDSGVLTGEQVRELATMNPLLVYDDVRVKVAILKGVRDNQVRSLAVQMQGVRDGKLTYKAGGTVIGRPLVPVLALMDAELVDRMRVSPGALALGQAAVDSLNPAPPINPMVDLLVTEYEESAPVEREFFLPTEDGDDGDTLPTAGNTPDRPTVGEVMGAFGTTEPIMALVADIDPGFYGEAVNANDPGFYSGSDTLVGNDPGFMQPVTYGDPTTTPNFTGTITFGGYVQEQPAMNTEQLPSVGTVEQVIPEPALIEDGEGVHVSDNLPTSTYQSPEALSVHPDLSPNSDRVDAAAEPVAVPGQGAVAYTVDPMGLPVIGTTLPYGVQEDGTVVPFDPAVHELPIDQLPM